MTLINMTRAKLILITSLIIICLLAACSNLPGKTKESANPTISDPTEEVQTQSETETESFIQRNYSSEWTEPSKDLPTVTAIVLGVEKKGETAPMIIRESNSESRIDNNAYSVSDPGTITRISTPVPNQITEIQPSGMYDRMETYSFNPRDGSTVLPGQSLHLDVTLKNTGTTTWQTNYKVSDISQAPMTVQREYTLPYAVAPGGTVLLSIYMAAPSTLGTYSAGFEIKDSYGAAFGQFYYSLNVGDFSVLTSIPTLTATITPTYYSPIGITATPDSLAWMCIDPERSKRQDCYSFCVEYSHRPEFSYCYYNGELYLTPVP
ncbi:MAG: hypothetical protein IJI14_18140 [Anaerolineaceae bacterium]|nr:hypothetical protein [Anaerolineaceae bacterium]